MRHQLMVLALLPIIPSIIQAQDDRRDRQEPELVVEAGGRTGTCDELIYSSDGTFLFAAGDDKVVRVWPSGPNGLDLTAMQTLRWPAWRDQRGGIKTIAVSPDGNRVLVGGYGIRTSSVSLIDRVSGEIVAHALPEAKDGSNLFGVMTAAFRPDGKQVAFGTADGSLWVWDLHGKPTFVARHEPIARNGGPPEFNRPRLVFYRDTKLISVAQGGEIRTDDLAEQNHGKIIATVHSNLPHRLRAYRATPTLDGAWVAIGANGPAVTLVKLDTATKKILKLQEGEFPRALAISRDSKRLAIGIGSLVPETLFHLEADHRIDVYEEPLTAEAPQPIRGPRHHYRAEALAFDQEGRLAVAGGDSHEVTVWELANQPKSVSIVRGAGRGLWAARISTSGRSIGMQTTRDAAATDPNRRGRGTWQALELRTLKSMPQDPEWVEPLATADGWRVVPSREDKYIWTVVRQVNGRDQPPIALPLDPDRDEAPQCYTFLPAKGNRPTRLIVGHYYGCTVFELTDRGVKKLMRCIGHAGEVTSVAPGPDHDWFISCGTDQTLAGWTLTDWPTHSRFGTTFTIEQGKLIVGEVDVGSPAWEMGLVKGDEIQLTVVGAARPILNVSGRHDGHYGPRRELTDAVVTALANPEPGVSIHLGWRRAGHPKLFEQATSLPHRPLWKFFPAFDSQDRLIDFVIWVWKTSHYYCSTNGDYLVGWHVNSPDLDGTPRFHRAEKFRDVFHRPLVILNLLVDRDYPAALRRALGENPQPISFGNLEPPPLIVSAKDPLPKSDAVTVQVALRQRGTNPDLMPERIELWVNDWRFKTWGPQPKGLDEPVSIPADKLRAGENVVTVQTFNRLGGRGEAQTAIRNPKRPSRPKLLGVAIGVNDYAGAGKNPAGNRLIGDLKCARKDAEVFRERLYDFRGVNQFFPEADVTFLPNAAAKRNAILQSLDDLAKRSGPDDRIVIFLAGHGDFVETKGKDGRTEKLFVFCCPNYDSQRYNQTGVTAVELFDKLAAIPGRKLVLVDACHSGQAAADNIVRALVPTGQGPTILAACDQRELSFENEKVGHGLFTYSVLEALGNNFEKADANHDRALGPDELFEYIRGRVPELLKQIGRSPYEQNPISFPRKPTRYTFVQKEQK